MTMLSPSQWRAERTGSLTKVVNFDHIHDVPSSDTQGMNRIFQSLPTSSGALVTETSAMRSSAVFAGIRLIAGAMASTPVPVYERVGNAAKRIDHPYYWLFNEEPTPRFTAASFWEYITAQMLLRGDGIAYIVRKNRYSPDVLGVIPVARENVEIFRNGDRLAYRINEYDDMGTQRYFTADQDDVLHFPGFGFNGLYSYSVISWAARQAIGISIAADEFAGQFFGNGAHVQYAITTDGKMTPQQQKDFRDAWVDHYMGAGLSGRPLILTEGLKVQEMSLSAVDSQLLESRKWQVIDIARALGVPPFMIGETEKTSSWGTGIESMARGFTQYTMQPHYTRFEQELNRKLFPVRYRTFMQFDTNAAMRGDTAARTEFYQGALGGTQAPGWLTPNEVRAMENIPPIEGGDTLFRPKPASPDSSDSGTGATP
jgi:HK97 family phage portal protein